MVPLLTLAIVVGMAPPEEAKPEQSDPTAEFEATAEPEASAEPELSAEYLEAIDRAAETNRWVNDHWATDTEESITRMRAAIEEIESFEEDLRNDEYGRADLVDYRKNLARALLRHGDEEEASQIVDGLVRETALVPERSSYYGEEFKALYTERKAAIEASGLATVSFTCHEACVAYVNDQPVSTESSPVTGRQIALYLGTYEIEIRGFEGGQTPPVVKTLELTEEHKQDPPDPIVFGEPPEPPAPVCPVECPDDCVEGTCPVVPPPTCSADCTGDCVDGRCIDLPPPPPKRILPLWAEISGLVAGVGLVGGGAGMLSVDGKCQVPGDDINTCPKLWESTGGGIAMIGVGVAFTVTSAVLLGIDEKRARSSKERQVRLSPTGLRVRF